MCVHPDRWRDGIGTELSTASVEDLPASVDAVRLSVLRDNDRAKRFYDGHGFERVDDGAFAIGGATSPTGIYRTRL